MTDQRRYGVIEVHRINADTYHLHDQRGDVVGSRMVTVAAALVHSRRRRSLPYPCRTYRRARPGCADSYQARQADDRRWPHAVAGRSSPTAKGTTRARPLGEPWVPLEDRAVITD